MSKHQVRNGKVDNDDNGVGGNEKRRAHKNGEKKQQQRKRKRKPKLKDPARFTHTQWLVVFH